MNLSVLFALTLQTDSVSIATKEGTDRWIDGHIHDAYNSSQTPITYNAFFQMAS